jgi:hypothetical protein
MSNVFTIVNEYDALLQQIEELGGEITPELEEQLVIKEKEVATKVRAYYYVIKTLESQIGLAKGEIERLDGVIKTKENVIKRIKKYVDLALEVFGTIKPSGAKGLDLRDLKVWQKKTIALNIVGDIDDARFCEKEIKFVLSYNDAKELLEYIDKYQSVPNAFAPLISIKVIKEKVKTWLSEREVEQTNKDINDADDKVIKAANLVHNSTVIFK